MFAFELVRISVYQTNCVTTVSKNIKWTKRKIPKRKILMNKSWNAMFEILWKMRTKTGSINIEIQEKIKVV